MTDKFVLVAAYFWSVEAQLARGRLEAEGIKVLLTGGESVDVFGGVQGAGGQVRLEVAEADADRAVEILAAYNLPRHADDGTDRPADDAVLWVCPLCGDAVTDDLSVCPSCESPRPARRKSAAVTAEPKHHPASQDIQDVRTPRPEQITSDTPLEAVPSAVEDDLDMPDLETLVGDDLVRRAFVASWIGVLAPYSLWLLARLAFYSGKISPRMMPRLYLTIAIDAFWFVCLFLLFSLMASRHPF